MLSVLYFVFTNIFKNDIPNYVLYLFLGIIMWNMFARATGMGLNSIVTRGGIVTKVYFPREILPLSSCITAFVMMLLEFTVFFVFVAASQFIPPATILFLPVLLFLGFVLSLGLALVLSSLNVYYRDVSYIWNFLLFVGFFITPIFYTPSNLPPFIQQLILLNPMAGIMHMAQNATLANVGPSPSSLTYAFVTCFAVLAIGYTIFRRYERRITEEL